MGSEILSVHTALRAIHSAAPGSISVIQHLARKTGKDSSLCCLEYERRHGSGILSEVNNQSITRFQSDSFTKSISTSDDDLAVFIPCCAHDTAPDI